MFFGRQRTFIKGPIIMYVTLGFLNPTHIRYKYKAQLVKINVSQTGPKR